MKKYFYFKIVLFPQETIVKDFVLHCTEDECHAESFRIVTELDKAGMSYNGKNGHHYYGLFTKEVPSPEELDNFFKRNNIKWEK